MLILNGEDIRASLTMGDAIEAVRDAFGDLARGEAKQPPAHVVNFADRSIRVAFKTGIFAERGLMSIKTNTLIPRQSVERESETRRPLIAGVVTLWDVGSGQILSLMDSGTLTAMRTGAVAGVATDYLARADACVAVIFGAGTHAWDQVSALCSVRDVRELRVVSRNGRRGRSFCKRAEEHFGIRTQWTCDGEKALREADMCVTITTSSIPVVRGDWLSAGIHLNAMGAYRADMRELDAAAVCRSRVVVDDVARCLEESGEIRLAAEERAVEPDTLVSGELSAVIAGTCPGRLDRNEITIFKSVGLGIQDTALAALAYERAQDRGRGIPVQL